MLKPKQSKWRQSDIEQLIAQKMKATNTSEISTTVGAVSSQLVCMQSTALNQKAWDCFAVLVDCSSSMSWKDRNNRYPWKCAQAAFGKLLELLNDKVPQGSQVHVLFFNHNYTEKVFVCGEDPHEWIEANNESFVPNGSTNAVPALEHVRQNTCTQAVVVITDGDLGDTNRMAPYVQGLPMLMVGMGAEFENPGSQYYRTLVRVAEDTGNAHSACIPAGTDTECLEDALMALFSHTATVKTGSGNHTCPVTDGMLLIHRDLLRGVGNTVEVAFGNECFTVDIKGRDAPFRGTSEVPQSMLDAAQEVHRAQQQAVIDARKWRLSEWMIHQWTHGASMRTLGRRVATHRRTMGKLQKALEAQQQMLRKLTTEAIHMVQMGVPPHRGKCTQELTCALSLGGVEVYDPLEGLLKDPSYDHELLRDAIGGFYVVTDCLQPDVLQTGERRGLLDPSRGLVARSTGRHHVVSHQELRRMTMKGQDADQLSALEMLEKLSQKGSFAAGNATVDVTEQMTRMFHSGRRPVVLPVLSREVSPEVCAVLAASRSADIPLSLALTGEVQSSLRSWAWGYLGIVWALMQVPDPSEYHQQLVELLLESIKAYRVVGDLALMALDDGQGGQRSVDELPVVWQQVLQEIIRTHKHAKSEDTKTLRRRIKYHVPPVEVAVETALSQDDAVEALGELVGAGDNHRVRRMLSLVLLSFVPSHAKVGAVARALLEEAAQVVVDDACRHGVIPDRSLALTSEVSKQRPSEAPAMPPGHWVADLLEVGGDGHANASLHQVWRQLPEEYAARVYAPDKVEEQLRFLARPDGKHFPGKPEWQETLHVVSSFFLKDEDGDALLASAAQATAETLAAGSDGDGAKLLQLLQAEAVKYCMANPGATKPAPKARARLWLEMLACGTEGYHDKAAEEIRRLMAVRESEEADASFDQEVADMLYRQQGSFIEHITLHDDRLGVPPYGATAAEAALFQSALMRLTSGGRHSECPGALRVMGEAAGVSMAGADIMHAVFGDAAGSDKGHVVLGPELPEGIACGGVAQLGSVLRIVANARQTLQELHGANSLARAARAAADAGCDEEVHKCLQSHAPAKEDSLLAQLWNMRPLGLLPHLAAPESPSGNLDQFESRVRLAVLDPAATVLRLQGECTDKRRRKQLWGVLVCMAATKRPFEAACHLCGVAKPETFAESVQSMMTAWVDCCEDPYAKQLRDAQLKVAQSSSK
jgi:hypothetical protein